MGKMGCGETRWNNQILKLNGNSLRFMLLCPDHQDVHYKTNDLFLKQWSVIRVPEIGCLLFNQF